MFKDTKEALRQLEEQLLSKEAPTQVLPVINENKDDAIGTAIDENKDDTIRTAIDGSVAGDAPAEHPGRYQNFANNYGGRMQPQVQVFPEDDLEDIPPQVPEAEVPTKPLTGLWILMWTLLAADLGIILYWIMRFWGVLR